MSGFGCSKKKPTEETIFGGRSSNLGPCLKDDTASIESLGGRSACAAGSRGTAAGFFFSAAASDGERNETNRQHKSQSLLHFTSLRM